MLIIVRGYSYRAGSLLGFWWERGRGEREGIGEGGGEEDIFTIGGFLASVAAGG